MAQANTPSADQKLVDMWECLTLMSYIQHAEKVPDQEPNTIIRNEPEGTTWRGLLNHICVLCDFDPAADNFIALGVEKKTYGDRFWVASNGAPTSKIKNVETLLKKLLSLLHEAVRADLPRRKEIAEEITSRSIRQSSRKVDNYHGRLRNVVRAAVTEYQAKPVVSESAWCNLSQALHEMIDENSHERLCQRAYDFPSSVAFAVLGDLIRAQTNASSRVQHYIGRLGSWKRAAVFIVEHAREFRRVFRKSTDIRVVQTQPSTAIIRVETNLRDLVSRQCPVVARNEELLKTAVQQLETAGNKIEKYRQAVQRPIAHAEAIVAQHFYTNKLQFAEDDRYVSSAKSSCYACALFLGLHPGNFTTHRSHGHAWLRWTPPRPEGTNNLESDREIWDLVQQMTQAMRRDIDDCILRRRYGTQQNFSSTTGITNAV